MCRFPLTVRLPPSIGQGSQALARRLAAEGQPVRRNRQWWLASFALSRLELDFARRLLRRKRNLWLFRTNQRASCGDFVVVDMSPVPAGRTARVIELKRAAPLRVHARSGGPQLRNARAAVLELADRGIIPADAPLSLASGGTEEVLGWLA